MGFDGRYDGDHYNPMAAEDKDSKSPLKYYQHLLPSSCRHISALAQHLFLVNVGILFPNEDPSTLGLTVARTSDQIIDPSTGALEERKLFYATLVQVKSTKDSSPTTTTTVNPRISLLIKGPAAPYVSPKSQDQKSAGNYSAKSLMSYSTSRTHVNEDNDLREVKEKAIHLLMDRMEEEIHKLLGVGNGNGEVEVWEAKGWKYAPPPLDLVQEGSAISGTIGHGKKRESGFSKN